MLTVVDEYIRECLVIMVERKFDSNHVLDPLSELFIQRGPPTHIRSDNGPEFCAEVVKRWLKRLEVEVKTLFIKPGSPWENGYVKSFNGKLCDELLNGEVFTTLNEAQVLISNWHNHYNRYRPHSALSYRPPAPEAWLTPPFSQPPQTAYDLQ